MIDMMAQASHRISSFLTLNLIDPSSISGIVSINDPITGSKFSFSEASNAMAPAFLPTPAGVALRGSSTKPLITSTRPTHRIARFRATAATPETPTETEWAGAQNLSKPSSWETVMTIEEIMKVLPHRYPFLLLDRVIEYEPGKRAVAIKNVSMNEPFFQGHFPDRPIMPGVLQVEALAQVGGIVMLQQPISDGTGDFFFGGVDKVKWRRPVLPGDTLVMEMTLENYKPRFGIAKMAGKAYVDGQLVVEGLFTLVMVVEK